MAQDDLDDEVDTEAEEAARAEAEDARASAAKAKRLTMIVGAGALVLGLLGGGAGGFFMGGAGAATGGEAEEAAVVEEVAPSVYVDLPKIHTNIATDRCRGLYINLVVTAEIGGEEQAAAARTRQELIKDRLMEFARSQTKEDLEGSEGAENLRANAEAIINDVIAPTRVRSVLFKEFLLQ